MGKFFRKSFNIDLKDSLAYPSGKTICDIIEREQKNVEFISKELNIDKQKIKVYKM